MPRWETLNLCKTLSSGKLQGTLDFFFLYPMDQILLIQKVTSNCLWCLEKCSHLYTAISLLMILSGRKSYCLDCRCAWAWKVPCGIQQQKLWNRLLHTTFARPVFYILKAGLLPYLRGTPICLCLLTTTTKMDLFWQTEVNDISAFMHVPRQHSVQCQ